MLHYEVVEFDRTESGEHRANSISTPLDVRSPILVCLHGFLESLTMWEVLQLQKFFHLILIDLPGHGKSGMEGIDSMRSMASEVVKVLDKEKVESYDVIGHSMGGYVGLELKLLDVRCQKLILLNSNVWADSDQKKADRQRVAKLVQTKKERFLSEAIPNLFENPSNHIGEVESLIAEANLMSSEAIARASLAMSERTDFSDSVFSGELPVSVIQGKNDPIADKERMEQIMQNHQDRFHVVNSGHMAHIEATDTVGVFLVELSSVQNSLGKSYSTG